MFQVSLKRGSVMQDPIGQIKDKIEDVRSGKLIFISHCLLNQNACVKGISSEPAMITPLIKLLMENDVGIYQMPCPEVSYYGSARWGQVKGQYSTPMFRKHCRKIAEQMFDYIENYTDTGHRVVGIVMRDGSPTCGLHRTAVSADNDQVWGGMVWQVPKQRFAETQGVYCEELHAELQQRQLKDVLFLSLPEVPEAGNFDAMLEEIRKAVQ